MKWNKKFVVLIVSIVILGFTISGYALNSNKQNGKKNFNFILKFGINAKNQINTFNGTYTKDMVSKPSITIPLKLSQKELNDIYTTMKAMDILRITVNQEDRDKNINSSVASVSSYSSYKLKIQMDSKVKELIWNDKSVSTFEENQLRQLVNKINYIILQKKEYKNLPIPTSSYN